MLGFVQNWFGPRCNPIGVDFGSDGLRMAQAQWVEGDWRLTAAASAPVPASARNDPAERWAFFVQASKELLGRGGFRGRTVRLGLPAAHMHILHLRMDRMDGAQLKRALPWETRGKLPVDPKNAVLRHVIAGEVYVDQEPRQEVIVLAAERETVEQLLASAAKARLDVVGMNIEPTAVLDCFTHVYRRAADQDTTNFFVDIGASGTRAILTRSRQILFARNIAIGGDKLAAAVARDMKLGVDEAKALRIKMCDGHVGNPTFVAAAGDAAARERDRTESACAPLLEKLVEELDLCRRYYEATFPARPVDRMVFIGGEARHRWLCQKIARGVGLAAQLGDPMCRMGKTCEVGPESGIDRRMPQPAWAVAIGLSMGPPAGEPAAAAEATATEETRSTHE